MSCGQNKTRTTDKENPTKFDGDYPCIDSVLQVRYGTQKNICFSADIKKHIKLIRNNNDIMDWLNSMQEESLSAYTITNNENRYLILTSVPWGVTGIATNFLFYLIIDCNKGTILTKIESLSRKPRCWSIENDEIHFLAFEFGKDFHFRDCDWNNLPLIAIEYVLIGNSLIEVSSFDFMCNGYL
jgi:hypothetical protein